ncbi:MAG: hypothetical protein WA830_14365 [Candidatus Sulfotelmatobacter sp.]
MTGSRLSELDYFDVVGFRSSERVNCPGRSRRVNSLANQERSARSQDFAGRTKAVDAANDEAVLEDRFGCNIGCGGSVAPTAAADASQMMPACLRELSRA